MKLLVVITLIGNLTVTSYQSVPNQTDDTPYRTSINERVNGAGIAVHPSLLCPNAKAVTGKNRFVLCKRDTKGCNKESMHYFDVVYVEDIGFKTVVDVMASSTKMDSKLDVWVPTVSAEKEFHKKFKNRKLAVWRIHNGSQGR
jgi:hypothetical protein